MPDPRNHVRPGQKLQVAADQINFVNRMMRAAGGMGGGPLPGFAAGTNIVYGKNVGAVDALRGAGMEITGIVIDPSQSTTAENQFWDMPCVEFRAFDIETFQGGRIPDRPQRVCVPLEPIAQDKIGRVVVSGPACVLFGGGAGSTSTIGPTAGSASFGYGDRLPFARVAEGGTFVATANSSSPARLLWYDEGGGDYALVQLTECGNRLHFGKSPDIPTWPPNAANAVDLYDNGPEEDATGTVTVKNTLFHPIAPESWVVVWSAPDGDWHVVSAGKWDDDAPPPVIAGHDLMQLDTYDPNLTQVLGHEQGELKWFSTTNCPP